MNIDDGQLEATKLLLGERYEGYRLSSGRAKAVSVYAEGAPLGVDATDAARIADDVIKRTSIAEAIFFDAQARILKVALDELDALG